MAHVDPRTRPVPPELVAMVREVIERRGLKGAARVLDLSRATVASVAAGCPAMAGTIAILWNAFRRRDEAA